MFEKKFAKARNSKTRGDIGMGAAIAWATANEYTVSIPLTDSQDYDLIIDNGKPLRVQIKTTKYKEKSGNYTAALRTNGGNRSGFGKTKFFDKSKVDAVFILCENGDMYLIKSSIIHSKNAITMSAKMKKFKI